MVVGCYPRVTVASNDPGHQPDRLLGVRDLVLGAGLLRSGNEATWLRARGVADALDAALILGACPSAPSRKVEPP
jgi:hypothetical protein